MPPFGLHQIKFDARSTLPTKVSRKVRKDSVREGQSNRWRRLLTGSNARFKIIVFGASFRRKVHTGPRFGILRGGTSAVPPAVVRREGNGLPDTTSSTGGVLASAVVGGPRGRFHGMVSRRAKHDFLGSTSVRDRRKHESTTSPTPLCSPDEREGREGARHVRHVRGQPDVRTCGRWSIETRLTCL